MLPESPVAVSVCLAGSDPVAVSAAGNESVEPAGNSFDVETSSVRSAEDEPAPQSVTTPVKDNEANPPEAKVIVPVANPGSSVVLDTVEDAPASCWSFVPTTRA